MTIRRMLTGGGALLLAAGYLVSLTFWAPRAPELAAIVMSGASALSALLAIQLAACALLLAPALFLGSRALVSRPSDRPLLWVVVTGLVAQALPFLAYGWAAVPLAVRTGEWLRFGAQNDFGIVVAAAMVCLHAMLLVTLLRTPTASPIA